MATLQPFRTASRGVSRQVVAHAQKNRVTLKQRLAAASIAAVLSAGCVADAAVAGEFDVRTLNVVSSTWSLYCLLTLQYVTAVFPFQS
jgi:hypothetical protein